MITVIIVDMEVKWIVKVLKGSGGYMTEKRFNFNVNKNCIEYEGKHFAYCNGEQNKIANKLNELHGENSKFKNEISSINDLLNEYYTADTSETPSYKLRWLLRELDCYRKAHDTVDWQAYKEKEFKDL